MFILRRISSDRKAEMNFDLGESYTLITKRDNPTDFEDSVKRNLVSDLAFAYIAGSGRNVYSLFPNQENYIMTSDGKTFAKISE